MIPAVLSLLVPTAIIYWGLGSRAAGRPRIAFPLFRLAMAMALAPGLTSCIWWVWLVGIGRPADAYFAVESALLLAAAAWMRRWSESGGGFEPPLSGTPNPAAIGPGADNGPLRLLPWAVAILAVFAAVALTSNLIRFPHGGWDAVAVWNLHARVLGAGPESAFEFYRRGDTCGEQGNYPLLLPATIARLMFETESTIPAATIAAAWFAAATVLLCGATVACVRGRTQALLATAALLGTSFFIRHGASQYADVPLACFMLAAVAAFVLRDAGADRRWLAVAGAAAGWAAWTKNEGILFIAALVAARVLVRRPRGAWGEAGPFAAGLLPVLAVVLVFKTAFAPQSGLIAGQAVGVTLARILDPARYLLIVSELISSLVSLGGGLTVALPVYLILLGWTSSRTGRAAALFAGAAFGLMLLGDLGVYVITPYPLPWHLKTSVDRVVVQLWPGALAAFFLAAASPAAVPFRTAGDG